MGPVSTTQQIDRAIAYLANRHELIAKAHDELGIPLAECLCAAIRRALELRSAEAPGPQPSYQEPVDAS